MLLFYRQGLYVHLYKNAVVSRGNLYFAIRKKMSGACKHGKFCGLYTRRTPLVDRWFSIGEKPKKAEKIEKIGKKITNLY